MFRKIYKIFARFPKIEMIDILQITFPFTRKMYGIFYIETKYFL